MFESLAIQVTITIIFRARGRNASSRVHKMKKDIINLAESIERNKEGLMQFLLLLFWNSYMLTTGKWNTILSKIEK